MYEGIPGKAEPKYKRRQKGQYKAPTVVTLPIAIYNSMETSSSTHLPVVMAGGEQLVFTDPSVSSPTTATEERSEIASGKKHTKTTATEERSEIASGTKHTKKVRKSLLLVTKTLVTVSSTDKGRVQVHGRSVQGIY